MKIKCYLATLWLSAKSDGTTLPRLIEKHIEGCEKCRKEAAAYNRLSTLLKNGFGSDEECELTWAEIKASPAFNKRETAKPRLSFALAASAACIMLVTLIGIWALQPKDEPKVAYNPNSSSVTTTENKQEPDKTQQVVQPQQGKIHQIKNPAPQPVSRPGRVAVKRIIKTKRTAVAEVRHEKPEQNVASRTEEVAEVPNNREDETTSVITTSHEEHVIRIMGSDEETSGANVTYTSDQGDQPRFVLVDL